MKFNRATAGPAAGFPSRGTSARNTATSPMNRAITAACPGSVPAVTRPSSDTRARFS